MHTQWLLIVQRNDRDLYVDLRAIFQPDARVATIIDRRWQPDRRIENGPVDTDRRRRQRRKPTTPAAMTFWDNVGFRVVNVGFRVVSLE